MCEVNRFRLHSAAHSGYRPGSTVGVAGFSCLRVLKSIQTETEEQCIVVGQNEYRCTARVHSFCAIVFSFFSFHLSLPTPSFLHTLALAHFRCSEILRGKDTNSSQEKEKRGEKKTAKSEASGRRFHLCLFFHAHSSHKLASSLWLPIVTFRFYSIGVQGYRLFAYLRTFI